MKPYYDEDGITIYHGDHAEILPAVLGHQPRPPSALITDPPYGAGYYKHDVPLPAPILVGWIECFDVVAIFGWPERLVQLCLDAQRSPREWITWWPSNGRNRGFNLHGLWRESEAIAVFSRRNCMDWDRLRVPKVETTTPMPNPGVRGDAGRDTSRMGDVWRDESPNLNPNQPARLHPNEKPVSVLRRLIEVAPWSDVVDPFMGSGSTLEAARQLGQHAIGIEIEERYCEIAAKRLGQMTFDLAA